jgi:mannitol-1-phosphate 5-dehydrogenase
MKGTLVQFGAGNIGRSFIGQLFATAGYEVVFVDVDERIVSQLNRRGEYTVVVKTDDAPDRRIVVGGVRGILADHTEQVEATVADADYVATAVGARALPKVAPAIARGIAARGRRPLDVIIAENVRGAADLLGRELDNILDENSTLRPGLVETSIGKMVPIMSEEDRARDPLLVYAEPYNTLIVDAKAFTTAVPDVPGLKAVDEIAAYVDRKLFIHNLGHAACAYLGYRADPSITYVWQAVAVDSVRKGARDAMEQAACALARRYASSYSTEDLEGHIDDLLDRFANSALGDTIFRVGRDLKRKLSRDDRLVGAMRLCRDEGCEFDAIAEAAAAGFKFRATDEHGKLFPADSELAEELAGEPTDSVVRRVCGLDPSDPGEARILGELLGRIAS